MDHQVVAADLQIVKTHRADVGSDQDRHYIHLQPSDQSEAAPASRTYIYLSGPMSSRLQPPPGELLRYRWSALALEKSSRSQTAIYRTAENH